jgi:membrane protease YdiL (CAAX protease family)
MSADGDAPAAGAEPPVDRPQFPVRATWPPGSEFPASELLLAHCSACGLEWRVHRDLNGFRLRCRCSAWVDVPRDDPPRAAARVAPRAVAHDVVDSELEAIHLRPPDETRALKNRTIRECILLAICFWGPPLALLLFAPAHEAPRYLPIAATVTCVLALLVVRGARGDVATALVEPRLRYWFEAIAMTAVALLLATGYTTLVETFVPGRRDDWIAEVRDQTGLGMAFFTIAICPGIFEELAFRGLVHGRLTRLLGATQGLLVTAALFALAHGPQLGLPIHTALGLYLGSLRARSGSLLPGMLCHIAYNGALVLLG